MKIAIFGDSFSDDNSTDLDEKSWIDVLKEDGIEIHNYSLSGTSLMWSYKQYLCFKKSKLNKKIDKIIFMITAPTRITTFYKNKKITITQLDSFDNFIKYNSDLDNNDKLIFESFKNYYTYFYDEEEARILADLIKKDILSDNRIIYHEPFKVDLEKNQISLFNISRNELKIIFNNPKIDGYKFMETHFDKRKCHMSEPNNIMIGKKFLQAILNGHRTIEIFSDDFVKPLNKTDQYFILRNHE